MTVEGWRHVIIDTVRRFDSGDEQSLEMLAKGLSEVDVAKQRLYDAGYGCTGMGILRTVDEVLEWIATHA